MASGGGRARADYDYLIKLLLIGDSGASTICASIYKVNNIYNQRSHVYTRTGSGTSSESFEITVPGWFEPGPYQSLSR